MDINVKQIHKQPFENLKSSLLSLNISGSMVNCCLVNAIRRSILDFIPTYASMEETIYIEKNDSIYDNDDMRDRLSQMTIPNININIPYLEDKYWKNINYEDPNRIRHPDDKTDIEMYVNVTNTSEKILDVTTSHATLLINGKESERFDKKYPILLLKLKPNQSFSCRCVHVLGVGKVNNKWAGGNIYYKEISENEYDLKLESQGQMDEYELLHKACIIIKDKNDLIRYKLKDVKASLNHVKIVLTDEDFTMCELINMYLQDHKDVSFAGVSKPNMLIDTMEITYITTNKNPLEPFYDILDMVDKIANHLLKQFEKLGDKYITYNKNNKK